MLTQPMNPAEAFSDLVKRLRGRRVLRKRLFLYTLQIYFEAGSARATHEFEVWCESGWRLTGPDGVATGSDAIEPPTDYSDMASIERAVETASRASATAEALCGLVVEEVLLDPATHALTIRFSDGFTVSTSVDDPEDPVYWVIRDPAAGLAVRGTPDGLQPGTRDTPVMTLATTDASLRLELVGYQFPAETKQDDDMNWLFVRMTGTHRDGEWTSVDPALQTWDVVGLAEWLDGVAEGTIAAPAESSFIEPNLRFELLADPSVVRVHFELEFRPKWLEEADGLMEDFWLDFPVNARQLRTAANSLRAQLERFPIRRPAG